VKATTQFWNDVPLTPADHALYERAENAAAPIADRQRALGSLAASDDPAARSVAMDIYTRASISSRQGNQLLVEHGELEVAMRSTAVRELLSPPYVRADDHAEIRRGANHASALAVLSNDARSEDASVLSAVIRVNEEPLVLLEAVKAAEPVLRDEPDGDPELLDVLQGLWTRTDLPADVRAGAVSAVGGCGGDVVVPMILRALHTEELAVSAAAARALLERDVDQFRAVVAPVAQRWSLPEFPPFDVHEVRELLSR
jgi:hypothetical protein